ncbi:MAG TPA: quinoprotein dehydrogenase-associated SoxYZ-like carrier, partial [Rhizobacter sp.]|nr:quinoprotein dehydrogenase-associated SoxYZ-like carrier [Rhizobacter sp.]
MKRRPLVIGIGALPLAFNPAARAVVGGLPSNTGHNDLSPQWEELRGKLFGARPIDAASNR